ncbi:MULTISPECIES: Wadjet anti-phage system protein JetD domain-containing protein [unclassified Oceanispirochaeta]|uniref:Wadjet anti-phage system protein JetD domain-containing protein n=1 Tax=unclassified Oceanispirochaeta TaxID=2635722 RepID=UPI000E09CD20|nr:MULTISPECIES: Wadjet anti-phage system protein JetD domain-containing protein [unclassified Oceanispirochaeta]MBF9015968.1 hypothetical protein [Oceanispirochaeta sp. M2]NPD72431.1 hypothetical protein [Oceanispirochaeta sp. M1]RDG32198.1 hypothetical protein DV872_09985 [Oceanispirochaeta sp. M1]
MAQMKWPGIGDLKRELIIKWDKGRYYRLLSDDSDDSGFPLRIRLKIPDSTEILNQFAEVSSWVELCRKEAESSGVQLEWQEINHRQFGRNSLPRALRFQEIDDLAVFIGRDKELKLYRRHSTRLLSSYPELLSWLQRYPMEILKLEDSLSRLLSFLTWVCDHPDPDIYLRQLSLPGVDTKFLEGHKRILSQWLDIILPSSRVNEEYTGIRQFERRYGFRGKPELVRFRILDRNCALAGLQDLSISSSDFSSLNPRGIENIIILENDITALSLPDIKGTMAVFGRGYSFENMKKAHWMRDRKIWYWGDLDSHGFAILSQFRSHYPHSRSILMDEETFLSCRDCWTLESTAQKRELTGLTEAENQLYTRLITAKWGESLRLEQEFIPFNQIMKALHSVGLEGLSRLPV